MSGYLASKRRDHERGICRGEKVCIYCAQKRVETIRTVGLALLKEYAAERDSLYDSVTGADGHYDYDENRQMVEEMDAIITRARAVLLDGQP